MEEQCIFCQIVQKKIPAFVVYEDEKCIAFLDINPLAFGHTLVIPKKHAVNIFDIDEEDLKHLIGVAKKLSIEIKDKLKADGVNIFQTNGQAAGQAIPHFHLHIVPRKLDDGLKFTEYWRSQVKKVSEDQLRELANLLRAEPETQPEEKPIERKEEPEPERSEEEIKAIKRSLEIA